MHEYSNPNRRGLRIGLVTCTMHVGGVETYLLRLGGYLKNSGFSVEIITTADKGEWFDLIAEHGLTARHFQQPLKGWKRYHAMRVALQLRLLNYDIIFLNHAPYAQHAVSLLSDKLVVIPVIHNDHDEVYEVAGLNLQACNAFVAASPKLRDTFLARNTSAVVRYIPYGINLPPPELLAARIPYQKPFELIFVGQLVHAHKGILFLPDIVRGCLDACCDIRLTVIGCGPDREQLERRCRELRIDDRVIFTGALQSAEVYQHMARSHIHLLTSFYEGLAIVLLESQANGCVPVSSYLQNITDVVVRQGETGFLVQTGLIQEYVARIVMLYENPRRWNEMSHAAILNAKENFSLNQMGSEYLSMIYEALDGKFPLAKSRKRLLSSLKAGVRSAL